MRKSEHDHRQFKYTTLDNGLRVFLVQDTDCEKSAASITINSGHFNDDKNSPGLSHLLEHMLFLGDHNNPTANHVSSFLESIGGSINAQTGTEYTSYFLDFPDDYLAKCLKLFSTMLIKPIFDEQLLKNEIQVIDAEFQAKVRDDLRRLYQVHKETCNPNHPFSRFSVGNKEIFETFSSSELRTKLINLHRKNYQPQQACMCVISSEDLLVIEQQVTQSFATWQTNNTHNTLELPSLYQPDNLAIKVNIEPIIHTQRLIITFALPSQKQHFRSKPLTILSHLLGDEGEGSLLYFYKQQGWATNLNAGGGIEGSNFKDFNINIQLTSLGIEKTDTLIQVLFAFISLIKNNGIENWRIEEVATINQLMWDFSDATKSIDETLHLSQAMFEYPAEFLLAGEHILDQVNAELALGLLDYFVPTNMRIKAIWPKVKTNKIANWYNTPYAVEKLTNPILQAYLNQESREELNLTTLNLSKPNPFLPQKQIAKPINQEYDTPIQLINQAGLQIWYGQDNKFSQPKGDCFLSFDCPAVTQGIEVVAAKRLWIALLNEKLNQRYYQANLAGMYFHFYPHQGGFSLQTNGFSQNQLTFYTKLLTQIVEHEDFIHSFEQVKNRQLLALSNKLLNKPINSLFSRLAVLMQQNNYLPLDMVNTTQSVTPEIIYQTKKQLLNQFHLKGLMYGDWTSDEADQISSVIKSFRANYKVAGKTKRGVADIRQDNTYIHQVDSQHTDSAVVIYFQSPDASILNTALTIIAEQIVAGPFFHTLRTEQQLGYLVGSGYIPYNQHPGLAFYIQSPHASVEQLIQAIHQFMQNFSNNLLEYSSIWQSIKKGVIKQLSEKDTNLSMKAQRLWMAISNNDFDFSNSQKMFQTIEKLELSDLVSFFEKLITKQGFGEIILHCGPLSTQSQINNFAPILDPKIFKKTIGYL
ncbi:insulinase family protein [Paraglaciecola aquimarina]|uniref:Protease 3 n=1 Tax=Paraglaciecola algarum TaxID=3050085 RepID=A0ABS9DFG9_9ALTE|nr:insulinase family protein [Paraglaciecola sp. G1-23]MCF2950351.1 insulinase family protein [Paraglaciecola sp. G1-23]